MVPEILSNYLKNKPKGIPDQTTSKTKHKLSPRFLKPYKNKNKMCPTVLPITAKTRHKGFFKLFQTASNNKHKRFPRFFETISKIRFKWSPKFFQTTSKTKHEGAPRYFQTTSKGRQKGSPRFFPITSKIRQGILKFF